MISHGVVRIGERVVNGLSPKSRDIAMVFQSYALYPHLTVYDNIAFALKIKKTPKDEIRRRVAEAAGILDLEPYLKRKPRSLSGGQRQRVAMGRAIVRQPSVFLMDEPLSNLDAKLRVQMRGDIKKIQGGLGVTTIYVTHDQVEAMTMGHRVAVMRKGELQQVAPPQELYDSPVNAFVGGFIGSPAMNMLEARIERRDGGLAAVFGDTVVALDEETLSRRPALAAYEGRDVVLGVRPEDLDDAALADGDTGATNQGPRGVARGARGGSARPLHRRGPASRYRRDARTRRGRGRRSRARPTRVRRATTGGSTRRPLQPADPCRRRRCRRSSVRRRALHFFDLRTGLAISRRCRRAVTRASLEHPRPESVLERHRLEREDGRQVLVSARMGPACRDRRRARPSLGSRPESAALDHPEARRDCEEIGPEQLKLFSISAAGVDAVVVVQGACYDADTDYLFEIAEGCEWIAAVTAWVDLVDHRKTASRLEQLSARGKLRAVRHLIQDERTSTGSRGRPYCNR